MLSYKQWKMLNESIMPSFNLGVVNPSNLGVQTQSAFMMDIEEAKMAKKKAKKKMFGDDDETGDGEMVEPASDKDDPDVDVNLGDDKGSCGDDEKCGAFSKKSSKKTAKKSSKKKCGADMDMHDMDDEDNEDSHKKDDDGGDEDELMFSKKKAKKKMMKSKKKMWNDDDDADGDEDDDDHHDDEEHENDDDDSDNDDEDDFDGEDDGDGDDDEEDDQVAKKSKFNLGGKGGDAGGGSGMGDAGPMFSKKKSKKASKKKMTAEATEDEKWWNSVRSMTGSNPDQKYGDGWTEYQTTAEELFTPVDTGNLTQAVRPGQGNEPGPGEVGHAPNTRIGGM